MPAEPGPGVIVVDNYAGADIILTFIIPVGKDWRVKILFSFAALLCTLVASAVDWIDISSAIAAREAEMVSAASGDSAGTAIGVFAADAAAEYVAGGRVLDTFFWHEAYSAFVGISPKRHPGMVFSFR